MNKTTKILIACLAFILTCLVAYIVTSLIVGKDSSSEKNSTLSGIESKEATIEKSKVRETINEEIAAQADSTQMDGETAIESPQIIVISKVKNGNKYTLKVECENVPERGKVYYKIVEINKTSNDGNFSNIPGCKSGKYTVVAINFVTNASIAELQIGGFTLAAEETTEQKMSVGEFQSLLLNQSDNSLLGGKNPRVARYVKLTCLGLRDDDYAAGDIQHVRDKIANGIWKTAIVISVNYNERGQINAATIKPVYYE